MKACSWPRARSSRFESEWLLRLSWLCPASPHTTAGAQESASFFLGLSFLTCRAGELEA